MVRVIDGKWDDLVRREDLQGRQVRVFVIEPGVSSEPPPNETPEEWLKRFHEWAHSHKPVGHFVDDSRESIYSGTLDDPR
jgi:hypothetical protein